MPWYAWRLIALSIAVLALALIVGDATSRAATQGFHAAREPHDVSRYKVLSLESPRDVTPDLRAGDVIRLHDRSADEELRYLRQRVGDTFVFDRDGGSPVTVRLVPAPQQPISYAYVAIVIAFVLIGSLLALRSPRQPEARALASMLLLFGVAISSEPQGWMPIWLVATVATCASAVQFAALGFAVHLATIFPDPQAGGARRWIRRANVPVSAGLMALALWITISVYLLGRIPPRAVMTVGRFPWVYYLVAITAAFWIAGRRATGADVTRVRWVSFSIAVGFSGVLVSIVLFVLGGIRNDWMGVLPLTLLAIPLGLGYAIVRHRVVDIGFVVNRALVFGTLSAIVVVAFMALEWILSGVLVKVSHLTSTSLELGLALVLGFSLRSIHARVDAAVDDIFFRSHHEAERALRTLAREVGFITDPRVAIARTHAALVARTGASWAAIYVIDGAAAVRADPGESPAPDRIDVDDPALVRLRASLAPLAASGLGSALAADRAFPMCVRDVLTGTVALGPKSSGEAYAPDEIATVEAVAAALGSALDALQTAALKAEIMRVLVDGAPLDSLRRTADASAWVRGVVPQPAGSLPGLGE